jgi:hypothetical protein
MSLCVYHYPSHLYEVAEYVRTLVPEYRFSLRQHAPLFGDLFFIAQFDGAKIPTTLRKVSLEP